MGVEPENITGKDELRRAVLGFAGHRADGRSAGSETGLGKTTVYELRNGKRDLSRKSLRTIVGRYRPADLARWEAAWERIHQKPRLSVTGLLTPRQLPRPTTPFVGRREDLDTLDRVAVPGQRTPVIVCITGMGGCGKTELVVQWAHSVTDRFPDGCLFMDLGGFSRKRRIKRTDALIALIHELGGGGDLPRKRRNRTARYRTLIADRRMLLIFDNVRDARHVRSLIPSTASSVTVVTSRDDLTALHALDGAHRITLRPLRRDAARELFGRVAGIDPATATPIVADFVDRLAGHPLALRLFGSVAAGRDERQLHGLIRDLGQDGDTLPVVPDLSPIFAGSYRALDERTARAFRLLGAHPGGYFDAEDVAALAGATLTEGRAWLEALRHANLLHDEAGTYRMHDLLREYARRIIGPDESPAAFGRLLDHYLNAAQAAVSVLYPRRVTGPVTPIFADVPGARDWFDQTRANLVAAVVEAARAGDTDHACALADAIWFYLHEAGHYLAAIEVHGRAADVAARTGRKPDRAVALDHLGIAQQHVGDYPAGLRSLTEALALHRAAGHRQAEGRTLSHLGALEARRGRYHEAIDHLTEALAAADEAGDEAGAANAVNNLGLIYQRQGRDPEALPMLDRAIEMVARTGDDGTRAIALNNRSLALLRMGRHADARADVNAALRLNTSRAVEADIEDTLGALLVRTGDLAGAEKHLLAALAVHRDPSVRNRAAEALTTHHLGELRWAQRRAEEALDLQRQALEIAEAVGEPDVATPGHLAAGEVLRGLGRSAEAGDHYTAALRLARQTGNRRDEAAAQNGIDALAARGEAG